MVTPFRQTLKGVRALNYLASVVRSVKSAWRVLHLKYLKYLASVVGSVKSAWRVSAASMW